MWLMLHPGTVIDFALHLFVGGLFESQVIGSSISFKQIVDHETVLYFVIQSRNGLCIEQAKLDDKAIAGSFEMEVVVFKMVRTIEITRDNSRKKPMPKA